MSRLDNAPQSGWKPPRWLFSVIAILLVAWWVSTQPPPKGERPAAPTPDQDARFEPTIPVATESTTTSVEDVMPAVEPEPKVPDSTAENTEPTPTASRRAENVPAKQRNESPSVSAAPKSKSKPDTKKADKDPLIIPNVTIKDQSGRVAFKGEIDLHPTFDRIERGEKFPHRNDGSTFRNLEGRLPKKPAGYYTEHVHPTPGIGGPGPQRVVIGKNGEAFYTHDHYNSFRKVRE